MSVCGTPVYMSPEAWEGRAVPASDQYSLACLYVELRSAGRSFPTTTVRTFCWPTWSRRPIWPL